MILSVASGSGMPSKAQSIGEYSCRCRAKSGRRTELHQIWLSASWVEPHPNGTTSTGTGKLEPNCSTSFPSSTTITNRLEAWAMIFSRTNAPPALDEVEGGINFIRTIDGQINHRVLANC